jgi:prepilin-type N-terminal cleavage/methylation domain-containing protein
MLATTRKGSRGGFTLIELLVVIAIIAVLVSLTTAAVMKFIGAGGARSTAATLGMIQSRLERQWKTTADEANRGSIPSSIQGTVDALAAGDALASKRAHTLYIKLRLKHTFPVSFDEVYKPYTAAFAETGYQKYLTERGFAINNYGSFTAEQQTAICLLMIMEKGPGGATGNELSGATAVLGTSPGGKEVRGLVDGWGNPLLFCRWPTGFAKLNPGGNPGARGQDSADRDGHLSAQDWPNGNRTLAQGAVGHAMPVNQAYKLVPVVASAGPDKAFGLNPATLAVTNATDANDNRYSTDNN